MDLEEIIDRIDFTRLSDKALIHDFNELKGEEIHRRFVLEIIRRTRDFETFETVDELGEKLVLELKPDYWIWRDEKYIDIAMYPIPVEAVEKRSGIFAGFRIPEWFIDKIRLYNLAHKILSEEVL